MSRKAKVLAPDQFDLLLDHVALGDHAQRDRVIIMLSFKCGLRACEIARLQWTDVTDAGGVLLPINSWIELTKHITKGKKPDTRVLMHAALHEALLDLMPIAGSHKMVIYPATGNANKSISVNALTVYLHRLYAKVGLQGCSSHTGRRTFITGLSRVCNLHGSSIKDVQLLARHADLRTTEKYIEPATRLIQLAGAA